MHEDIFADIPWPQYLIMLLAICLLCERFRTCTDCELHDMTICVCVIYLRLRESTHDAAGHKPCRTLSDSQHFFLSSLNDCGRQTVYRVHDGVTSDCTCLNCRQSSAVQSLQSAHFSCRRRSDISLCDLSTSKNAG